MRTSAVPNCVMVIARLDAGLLRRRSRLHRADHRGLIEIREHIGAAHQDGRKQHHGEEDVHRRPRDQDLEPLPLRLRQELVIRAGLRIVGVLAGHLDVAAERDGADAVSVSPRCTFNSFGPKPSENVSTRTPFHRASRKWPSSWMKTSTPRTNKNDKQRSHCLQF